MCDPNEEQQQHNHHKHSFMKNARNNEGTTAVPNTTEQGNYYTKNYQHRQNSNRSIKTYVLEPATTRSRAIRFCNSNRSCFRVRRFKGFGDSELEQSLGTRRSFAASKHPRETHSKIVLVLNKAPLLEQSLDTRRSFAASKHPRETH